MDIPDAAPSLRQRPIAATESHAHANASSTGTDRSDNAKTDHTPASAEASSILSSSFQGASYLVLLQFISRMLTFTLNQVLLRFTSAETLGVASVQLELLLNTILFLSREGVRCAAIRVSDDTTTNTAQAPATTLDAKTPSTEQAPPSSNQDKDLIQPGTEAYKLHKLVNMVYAPIPIGALMTCLAVGYSLAHVDDASESRIPGYRLSIYLYGAAALIELLSEPMFMVAQYKLWFKTRVSVEGTAVIVRCVLTCALTIYGARESVTANSHYGRKGRDGSTNNNNTMGVLAFAIAQFVYGVLILGMFLLSFWKKSAERHRLEVHHQIKVGKSKKQDTDIEHDESQEQFVTEDNESVISLRALLPRKLVRIGKDGRLEEFYFDTELLKLSKTLTAQSILKHILTEGDKMLMAGFTQEADQGVYAFVVNYGSLVARILFQPLEETSRTLFSKLLSDIPRSDHGPDNSRDSKSTEKSVTTTSTHINDTQRSNLILSRSLLLTIMKFHILLGLVFISFGTHYTATLIDLIVGKYWARQTPAASVLSFYCYYVPIMGINGITEAVVQAVASEKELNSLSYWMFAFSAVFCTTGYVLMGWLGLGAKGIVIANCVNLTMRIIWSIWFLSRYFNRHLGSKEEDKSTGAVKKSNDKGIRLAEFFPSRAVLLAFTAAFFVTSASEQWIGWDRLLDKIMHIGVGVGALTVVVGAIFVSEKPFLREIQSFARQRR
ncbi:Oligosaccharide translocation protein rft1 [Lunasporangiospora selenospora]|uniref:Man(5)GlcNAc(2)-PP-dolichol translocation protein RFT1 n=1 Tax=Lunasporangiospora selenospora TaxID=979761 RepID=A0A9P6G1A1_9FUNG|nr:Oligosaccharide translocation protein rft1 [Lunasporangiospora selenospora]